MQRVTGYAMNPSLAASGARHVGATDIRALCDNELQRLCVRHPEVSLALVATADAWLISSRYSERTDANRLSAMTASLLALCEALSQELSGGSCQSVLLSMDSYTCVIVHITGAHRTLVLAVGVRQDVMLALARRFALDLAERISSALHILESDTP
jgi:predicted regulator of Ras-like GTPase activity (Roadblock/LC7/MglB family)